MVIRLALCDDQQLIVDTFAWWFETMADDVEVVMAVTRWDQVLTQDQTFDVVLLGLMMEDRIEATAKIRLLAAIGAKTIVITENARPEQAKAFLSAGAAACLPRSQTAAVILNCIRAAHRGESSTLGVPEGPDQLRPSPTLTPRQRQVAELYWGGGGKSSRQVAATLGIGEQTVKAHLHEIRRRYAVAGTEQGTSVMMQERLHKDGWIS